MTSHNYSPKHRSEREYSHRLLTKAAFCAIGACMGAVVSDQMYQTIAATEDAKSQETTWLSKKTTEQVSLFAHRQLEVECNSDKTKVRKVLAFVSFRSLRVPFTTHSIKTWPSSKIIANEDVCYSFISANHSTSSGPQVDEAFAMNIFSHEIEHTNGILDEAKAQCYGVQRMSKRMEHIGYPEKVAEDTAEHITGIIWNLFSEQYKTKECHKGGEFDLKISDAYMQKPQTVAIAGNDQTPKTQ